MKDIYLALFLVLLPSLAGAYYEDDLFEYHMNMGNFGFFGGGIFMILLWILIIIGIVYLFKYLLESGKNSEKEGDRAIEILKERYVKGEINKEEFEQKKKELT